MKTPEMGEKMTESSISQKLVHKMFELEQAYRDIDLKDRELRRYKKMGSASKSLPSDQEMLLKDREIAKLQFNNAKLEEKLKIARTQAESAKRDLKHEQEGREIVERRAKALDKENKEMKVRLGTMRVKQGVATANYNVSKQETDELKAKHQENQILIARLEERVAAANHELQRLRNPIVQGSIEETRKSQSQDKKEVKRLRAEVERLNELREIDQQSLSNKEEEIRQLEKEIDDLYERIANMDADLEQAEMDIKTERSNRENFEKQSNELQREKQLFDDIVQMYKVKLGITQAGKNVNHKQAASLRKKDEEYKQKMRSYEMQLQAAQVEIERLKVRTMPDSTVLSRQQHKSRFRKHSDGYEGFGSSSVLGSFNTARSGWTPRESPSRTPMLSPLRTPRIPSNRSRVENQSTNSTTANSDNNKTPVVKNGRPSISKSRVDIHSNNSAPGQLANNKSPSVKNAGASSSRSRVNLHSTDGSVTSTVNTKSAGVRAERVSVSRSRINLTSRNNTSDVLINGLDEDQPSPDLH